MQHLAVWKWLLLQHHDAFWSWCLTCLYKLMFESLQKSCKWCNKKCSLYFLSFVIIECLPHHCECFFFLWFTSIFLLNILEETYFIYRKINAWNNRGILKIAGTIKSNSNNLFFYGNTNIVSAWNCTIHLVIVSALHKGLYFCNTFIM